MQSRMRLAMALALVAGLASPLGHAAAATDCTRLLADRGFDHGAVTVATLDGRSEAGYATLQVSFMPAQTLEGTTFPAHWSSAPGAPALHRMLGTAPTTTRPGAAAGLDDGIGIDIVVDDPPWATVSMRGNPHAQFELHCTASGVMHGASPEGDYLFTLTQGR